MARTFNEVYLDMRRRLRQGGIEDPSLESRRLLACAAGCSDAELIARFFLYAGDEIERTARDLCLRRLEGEPLAYIAGSWDFYGLKMLVSPDVLIPRMDTEVLVSAALGILRGGVPEPRILDLCCGSGCIGCALAHALPTARVILADISREALSLARKNAALHRLSTRCVCLKADAKEGPPIRMEHFDMIVCNPPYVTTAELGSLDPSVRDWEPRLALDGGPDGLDFYRAVPGKWKSVLKDGGTLMFEVGEGQAEPVREILREEGFTSFGSTLDTLGTERVVFARKETQ